jgi:hypothetical protein
MPLPAEGPFMAALGTADARCCRVHQGQGACEREPSVRARRSCFPSSCWRLWRPCRASWTF